MIRNLIIYTLSKRSRSNFSQVIVNRQYSGVQFTLSHFSRAEVTKLNIRVMSMEAGRNLFYDDIVNMSSQKGVMLIDVREPDEIKETGLLPGSVHIPLGEVSDALKRSPENFKEKYGIDKPGQDESLIFSCRSGKRSQIALATALEQGYANSKHYAGGWLDWESKTKG